MNQGLEVTLVTRDTEKKEEEKIRVIEDVDCLLWAIGREPNISGLNLSQIVNEFKRRLIM